MHLNASVRRRTTGIIAAAAALAGLVGQVQGSAPQQKAQAPGYYRVMVGDIEITALNDGTFEADVSKVLHDIKPEALDEALARSFLKSPIETSINGFLVNTGTKLVLVDAGAGAFYGPTLGNLVANLKAAGYQPEQVDEIYLTHMHADHVGGLVADGKRVFPNAVVRAAKAEGEYWLRQSNLDAASADAKPGFRYAMTAINPYRTAGKYKPFVVNMELAPGVYSMATGGHTPGHTAYVVKSKGEKLILWGDVMHVASVQLSDPEVTVGFDSDHRIARAVRIGLFSQAADAGALVGGAHLPFPGLGHLRRNHFGFDFVPVNYTQLN